MWIVVSGLLKAGKGLRFGMAKAAPMRQLLSTTAGRNVAVLVGALALATAVGIAVLWPDGEEAIQAAPEAGNDPVQAEVTQVTKVPCQAPEAQDCTQVSADVLSGPDEGSAATFSTGNTVNSVDVSVGDHVRLIKNEIDPNAPVQTDQYTFLDFEREGPLIWLAVVFAVVVVLFGRLRGAMSLLGLGASLVVVFAFVVPAMLSGTEPVLVAAVGASAVMLLTISLAHGLGAKSMAAILGTTASLALTIGLALLFSELTYLTGFGSEESSLVLVGNASISLRGLVIAAIVIGALGVLDDVTVSQASTVMALRRSNPDYRLRELFREALDVGHDHVAATVNTLVLAYVGASLPILLVFSVSGVAVSDALNTEAVAEALVGMLVGSIGLIAAVPITTALAATLAVRLPPEALGRAAPAHAH
jgi:uncharacterized membrane protein